jgi:hypothetical protein
MICVVEPLANAVESCQTVVCCDGTEKWLRISDLTIFSLIDPAAC